MPLLRMIQTMISRLMPQTSYAAVSSKEEDVVASSELKHLPERAKSYANPLALLLCALIFATSSAVGLGIGMWISGSKDAIPSWTQSLSRGTRQKHEPQSCTCFHTMTDQGFQSLVEFSWKQQTFRYNRTFAIAPSEDESTETVWNDLVPRGFKVALCIK